MLNLRWEKVQRFCDLYRIDEKSLAEEMGISWSYFYRVKNQTRQPGKKFIDGLLKVTQLRFDDLFFWDGNSQLATLVVKQKGQLKSHQRPLNAPVTGA